jgi:hypothetical protein
VAQTCWRIFKKLNIWKNKKEMDFKQIGCEDRGNGGMERKGGR